MIRSFFWPLLMTDLPAAHYDITKIAKIDAVPLILKMIKQITGMRFAAVARVTEAKWVACAVDDSIDFGLQAGGELVAGDTICDEIRVHHQPVVFQHASEDPVYVDHHTRKLFELESYISIPIIRANGEFFGTICAIDRVPAHFDESTVVTKLELFAQLIAVQLDMQEAQEKIEAALIKETETGRLREQFIAVLGHDLRSPLTAIGMSAELLESKLTVERDRGLATSIKQSSKRMSTLIEDVLDFSKARLGSGIPVKRMVTNQLTSAINDVVDEIALSNPNTAINRHIQLPEEVFCDTGRVGQLLSNLLVNAVTHGAQDSPIGVSAVMDNNEVVLCVTNQGKQIPPELISLLFHPFTRSEAQSSGEGLGLGLYIAAQIVAGHEGTLDVQSTAEAGTCFVARFPNNRRAANEA
tara:strand:- start:1789 stop:3024 length:1236 start_codon:yes stop_codon:yes gene_type:complete